MKIFYFIFAHVLSASEISFSPVLFHFLCSNGYMSPSIDIKSLLDSPPTHSKKLVQIVTEAQRSTRLVTTSDDKKNLAAVYKSDDAENNCFRNVLETANILQYHQILFLRSYNCMESIIDYYHLVLYWAKKDFSFLLSIKPQKNMALGVVLHSFHGKILKLTEEYQRLSREIPPYSTLIMNAYKTSNLPAPPLPPFDVNWAKANDSVEPKVHYSLLSELYRRKIIGMKYINTCKKKYCENYQKLIKNKSDNLLDVLNTNPPAVILKHKELHYSITTGWLAFWMLGMRIKRAIPITAESAFGTSLIESLTMEIKAMEEVAKEDGTALKYELKCSCLHMDHLIGCMRLALQFDLLNPQEHAHCNVLILTHHELAFGMIDNLSSKVQ